MTINIPIDVKTIINKLNHNGYEAFIVGGCVRDSLLNKTPHDWDICSNATPEQVKEVFQDKRVIDTGIQHGTVTVVLNSEQYEITTYRVDGEYIDNRHPNSVLFVNNLKEDLARRDFTINAMAYHPKIGLVDYFNGVNDLKQKLIRCVGNPDDRFNEDVLRIMRALRFASVYDFSIAKSTDMSIRFYKDLLNNIAAERINAEFCKLLCGVGIERILKGYSEVIGAFIPEVKSMIGLDQHNPYHIYDVWEHTIKAVVNTPQDIIFRLTLLFHDIGKPLCFKTDETGVGHFYGHGQYSSNIAETVLKRLKFDNNTIQQVKELVLYHDIEIQPTNKSIKRWLNKIGEERLRQLVYVKEADVSAQSELDRVGRFILLSKIDHQIDEVIEQQQCFSLKNLAINGKDLIGIGIHEGRQIGIVLNKLMDMVINEKLINDKNVLLEKAQEYKIGGD